LQIPLKEGIGGWKEAQRHNEERMTLKSHDYSFLFNIMLDVNVFLIAIILNLISLYDQITSIVVVVKFLFTYE
jgi:hypothetical protein